MIHLNIDLSSTTDVSDSNICYIDSYCRELNLTHDVMTITGWVMAFVYISLRGTAIMWYEDLKRSDIALNFPAFSTTFLSSFPPAETAHTAILTVHDVKQQATESVVAFYPRVVKMADIIELLLSPAA